MSLLENPFHVLGASLRDDRRRLLELAEERSLSMDPSLCSQARADLTNPRNRLAAEMAWLPGLDPARVPEAMESVQRSPAAVRQVEGVTGLAKANLLAAALAGLQEPRPAGELPVDIVELSVLLELCDPEKLRAQINEERAIAGFPEVRETSLVAEALADRRRHYRTALKNALEVLSPLELVSTVTSVVTEVTARGTRPAPALIDDLVDTYEVEAQRFLDAEARNVELLVEAIRRGATQKRPREVIQRLLSRLEDVVTNWDMVAQPIQLSSRSRGLDHALSHRVAGHVRALAVDLFNEHGMIEESKFLTDLLQDAFEEVPRVAEVTNDDAQALRDIAQKREAAQKEWAEAITYQTYVGSLSMPLKISPEGIEWDGVRWPLESITRLRWGGIVNTADNTAQFIVIFGNEKAQTNVTSSNEALYSNLTERMWRAVGHRLLLEMLAGLAQGKTYPFGGININDTGVQFWRFHAPWRQLDVQSANGSLVLRSRRDPSTQAELPYLQVDNVHILSMAVRKLLDSPNFTRLSELLSD
jgi:hypothetical protein